MRTRIVGFVWMLWVMTAGCGGGGGSSNGGSSTGGGGSTTPTTSEILFINGNGINGYSIDLSSGGLTQVSTLSGAPGGLDMAVTPNGRFLYTPNTPVSVVGYSIDANGDLTSIPGSPFPNPETNGFSLNGIAIDPGGKFLYTGDMTTGNIIGYAIDATSGALTAMPLTQAAGQSEPRQMTVSTQGKFLYVTDDISEGVLAFSIDSTTGAVTEVAGSPFAVPAGGAGLDIVGVASDPSGKFLYTANDQGKGLSGFVIDSSSGGLTNVPGSPYITANTQATQTCCVATHPSGKFVYALNQNGATVSAFTMDATSGTLTAVAGSPFAFPIQSDGSPSSAIGPILIEPSGKFMYVGLGDLNLAVFAIDGSTGALKQAKEALVPLPFAAQAMAITTKQQ